MEMDYQQRLLKAQQAVEKASEKVKKTPYRLGYHIMAPANWINDPNGVIEWNGEYHVFFQHHPYGAKGGPIHWGHVKSTDLVHWEHLPIALAPGDECDKSGCFSGSAIDHEGKLTLFYTGHVVVDEEKDEFIEYQCMAESTDGVHFTKRMENPIITNPPQGSSPHFRDPKVWEHAGKWYMVLGSQKDDLGRVVLYESTNLVDWEYRGVLAESTGKMGYMFECPDFFELDGKHILLFSPQGIEPEGERYQNLYQNGYYIGDFDYETKKFLHQEFVEFDKGFDFYAGQSFLDSKGRRIVIGWMAMWESQMPEQEHGWAGALTIPREVTFNRFGQLSMKPVEELKNLRTENVRLQPQEIKNQVRLDYLAGDRLEISAEFSLPDCTADTFGFHVCCSKDGTEKTRIVYDVNKRKLAVDRNHSGKGEGGIRHSHIPGEDDTIRFRLFLDSSSVELFVNDGETVMTTRIYPDPTSTAIELFATNGSVKLAKFDAWTLKDIWE